MRNKKTKSEKPKMDKPAKGTIENPHKIERGYIDGAFKPGYTVYWSLECAYIGDGKGKEKKWRWEEVEFFKSETAALREFKSYIKDEVNDVRNIAEREYWDRNPNRHTVSNLHKKITKDTTDATIDAIVEEAKALRDNLKITPVDKPFKWSKQQEKEAREAAVKLFRIRKHIVHATSEILEVK